MRYYTYKRIKNNKTASESEILKPDRLLNPQKIFHRIPHSRLPQIQHFLFVDQKNCIFGFRIRGFRSWIKFWIHATYFIVISKFFYPYSIFLTSFFKKIIFWGFRRLQNLFSESKKFFYTLFQIPHIFLPQKLFGGLEPPTYRLQTQPLNHSTIQFSFKRLKKGTNWKRQKLKQKIFKFVSKLSEAPREVRD
jgi:hypothetical protein